MYCEIKSVVNHKSAEYVVYVNFDGIRERFPSMMDAQKWIQLMKDTGRLQQIYVSLRDVIITAKKQIVYESQYVY